MTWIKVDAAIWMNPKIRTAGPRAAWLYVSGLGYAALAGTNGAIPALALATICPERDRKRLAGVLVEARLWTVTDAGWQIHDYTDWQPTKGATAIHDSAEKPATSAEIEQSDSPNGLVQVPLPELGFSRARARGRAGTRARAPAQEREERKERKTPPNPPTGGASTPIPVYPKGGQRERERRAYAEFCAAYAAEHFPDMPHGAKAVHQAIRYGKARTLDEVKAFIAEHWSAER